MAAPARASSCASPAADAPTGTFWRSSGTPTGSDEVGQCTPASLPLRREHCEVRFERRGAPHPQRCGGRERARGVRLRAGKERDGRGDLKRRARECGRHCDRSALWACRG